MDALVFSRATSFARATLCALATMITSAVFGATYGTANFVVESSDASFARQVAEAAEAHRVELANLWLGKTMRNWSAPCSITVVDGENVAPGGETVFSFSEGRVFDWKMRVQGSRERILDSVLPHEITHTIIASYLGAPAPRWLDEGMATSVEAEVERDRYRKMLANFLHTDRGIPFNDMIAMKEYPDDLSPFYSQSFSVCEYLILVGGRRRLADFAKSGRESGNWREALKEYYDCDSLGALQIEWLEWIRRWDVAQQPKILPTTRTLPEYQGEALLAYDASKSAVGSSSAPNWDRDAASIARGQNAPKKMGENLWDGFARAFGSSRDSENAVESTARSSARGVTREYARNNFRTEVGRRNVAQTDRPSRASLLVNGAGSATYERTESAPIRYAPGKVPFTRSYP